MQLPIFPNTPLISPASLASTPCVSPGPGPGSSPDGSIAILTTLRSHFTKPALSPSPFRSPGVLCPQTLLNGCESYPAISVMISATKRIGSLRGNQKTEKHLSPPNVLPSLHVDYFTIFCSIDSLPAPPCMSSIIFLSDVLFLVCELVPLISLCICLCVIWLPILHFLICRIVALTLNFST